MGRWIGTAALIAYASAATFASAAGDVARAAEPTAKLYKDGLWFDGETFVRRTMLVSEGKLKVVNRRRDRRGYDIVETVKLDDAYVTPPFCEAQNESLGAAWRSSETVQDLLEEGVFYVKVANNSPRETGLLLSAYNRPGSVDAAFSNGGVTGPEGYPIKLREQLRQFGAYEGFRQAPGKDHAFFEIANVSDLDRKWPLILQYRPDYVRLHLVNSDSYDARAYDPRYFGDKGLSPEVFATIAERARAHGLRVSAYVESAHDFRVAVAGGADEIVGLPGARMPVDISEEDARLAADRGVTVITAAAAINRWKDVNPTLYAGLRAAQERNLRRLAAAGVRLAIGTDDRSDDVRAEVEALRSLKIFDNATLLKMWTENCAATIFPDRKVGRLETGYDASFLIFAEDPSEDFRETRRIQTRVKDGEILGGDGAGASGAQ